jgi:hypothetical protein
MKRKENKYKKETEYTEKPGKGINKEIQRTKNYVR